MEKFKDLPNTPGFRFIGFGYDVNGCRDKGECEVYKNPDGTHSVRGHFDFSHLVGWEHIKTAPEKSRLTSGCSSTSAPQTMPCICVLADKPHYSNVCRGKVVAVSLSLIVNASCPIHKHYFTLEAGA